MKNTLPRMDQSKTGSRFGFPPVAQFAVILLFLVAILGALFWKGIRPDHVVFSNDGPLGVISSVCSRLPDGFTGNWQNQNWVGIPGASATPDISAMLAWMAGPLIFAKIYPAFALLFLGLSAWLCFRQWKFSPLACIVGALAVGLNSDFFSTACWGVAGQPISFGCDFLALAALADETSPRRWIRTILAGFAVGVGVMEAFDIGAVFSLVVAAYALYQGLLTEGPAAMRLRRGISRLAVIALCAGFIAAAALTTLIGTQIQGVAGMGQDAASKARRWDEATMWSMPKLETLSMVVPGLFGFRMDTANGGSYWGKCGRDAAWDRYFAGEPLRPGQALHFSCAKDPNIVFSLPIDADGKVSLPGIGDLHAGGKSLADVQDQIGKLSPALAAKGITVALERPGGFIRYGGGGIYTGVVVVLIALWAALQGLRGENSVFTPGERKYIWFWVGLTVLCVLIGFGRFAPFYQFFYALPFASTMRSPSKFFHVVEWATVILFAYGVHGLSRLCVAPAEEAMEDLPAFLKTWWEKATSYDRKWIVGIAIAFGVSVLGWLIYASSADRLVAYLKEMALLDGQHSPEDYVAYARATAAFSIRQVGWYIVFLALGIVLLASILSGFFAKSLSKRPALIFGAVLFGILIIALILRVDYILLFALALAAVAFISSGFFPACRAKLGVVLLGVLVMADLGRANLPWVIDWNWVDKYASNSVIDRLREKPYEQRVAILPFSFPPQFGLLSNLYEIEWKQQLFPFYNVQSLNIIMMPRPPVDYMPFEMALSGDGTQNSLYKLVRHWQLTNTRYLLGPVGFLDVLNTDVDPDKSFKILARFDLSLKPGITEFSKLEDITAEISSQGQYAIFDYTAALPRAKLYSDWQVITNDDRTLAELASRPFNPQKLVLVASPLPAPSAVATNSNPGTIEFQSYEPKKIVLKADASAPSVLLLNDKTDSNWHVTVDGKPETMLRCNYLMRGVFLQPGSHVVEFRYQPFIGTLYVSTFAAIVAVLLVGYLVFGGEKMPSLSGSKSQPTKSASKSKR